ncbi:hypothetical protein BDF14DRAFT_1869357, partial [Spinellus fusiger]
MVCTHSAMISSSLLSFPPKRVITFFHPTTDALIHQPIDISMHRYVDGWMYGCMERRTHKLEIN